MWRGRPDRTDRTRAMRKEARAKDDARSGREAVRSARWMRLPLRRIRRTLIRRRQLHRLLLVHLVLLVRMLLLQERREALSQARAAHPRVQGWEWRDS
jgi:hypothetical protein